MIEEASNRLAAKLAGTQHEKFFAGNRKRYFFALRLIGAPPAPGAKLLDAGASPGHLTALCLEIGWDATAADKHPTEQFQPKCGAPSLDLFSALGILVYEVDLAEGALPFADSSFDAVMFNETLEHLIGSPLPAMKEFARVLKPGGRLALTTPNAVSLRNRLSFLFGRNIYTALDVAINVRPYKCHNREYTLNEVKELAARAGLKVERAGLANIGQAGLSPLKSAVRSIYYCATWLWPPGRSLIYLVASKP
jgi:SAM-dependent methyltransferase